MAYGQHAITASGCIPQLAGPCPADAPSLNSFRAVQVREFVDGIGVENLGKRLINSREGKVVFEKPKMHLPVSGGALHLRVSC